jgi:uncharacterized protein YceK
VKKTGVMVLCVVVVGCLSGCMSSSYHVMQFRDSAVIHEMATPGPYPGTRYEINSVWGTITQGCAESQAVLLWLSPLFVLDLPLNIALDTVFLPYDIFQTPSRDTPLVPE